MRAPDGYRLEKCCIASPRSEVHFALRDDGAEVVLKAYPGRAGAPGRVQRELELLNALEPGHAPRALGVAQADGLPVLVLERLPGESPRGRLPVARFLPLAVRAARALGRVHAARVVHQNVRPESLLVDDRGDVRIIGFGRAAPLGAPSDMASGAHAFDGPLQYMAPEQTGRLERGVDFRSDLYALGATFYELLSGAPPFDARDPLDLIHAHIAHRAPPLVELAPDVPATLSRIVLKLLEKEPEDRYQTAEALEVDLDTCREQLERTGAIDDELPLGSADAPYRPLFRRRIYGRDAECAVLQRAYRQAAAGAPTLLLVHGAPGIGKSALVPELHRPLALDGGYLARGKFDLYRGHLPYAGFRHALQSLLRQIATETEARRASWRDDLHAALGNLAGVVPELVPELASLLGEVAPVPRLEPRETQQRLALAVRRFVLGAARHARPLVLFLDDLQWADAGSRYLLEELLLCGEPAPLLVIGAYRDSGAEPGSPLHALLERLQRAGIALDSLALGPLSAEAAREMLGDAMNRPVEQVRELAERMARHSGNNPLLIQQCVYLLHQLGCIRFTPREGWTWDLDAPEAAVIPDDPVAMLVAKLQRLGAEARSVAQLASCVGDEFDVGLLAELGHREPRVLEAAIYELSDEGLIAPCGAGFRFVHDRIREAAQSLLPEAQRAQLHLRTAQLLLERLPEPEQRARCFEIADHLCRAAGLIPGELRLGAIELHRRAGAAALQAGASASAAHYLAAALELFHPSDWSERAELGFDLHLQAAECAYQTREFERALELLGPLEARALSRIQSARVAAQRIKVYTLSRPIEETLERMLAELRRIGSPLPRRPSWLRTRWALARTDWLLRSAPETWTFRPYAGGDLSWAAPILIRIAAAQAIALTTVRLACLHCADEIRASLQQGYLVPPGPILAGYAGCRAAFLGHSRGMRRYRDAALHWMQAPPPTFGATTEFLVQAYANAWTVPRAEVLEPLRKAAEQLQELGAIEHARNALLIRAHYMGLSGAPVGDVVACFEAFPARGHLTPIEEPRALVLPYRLLITSRSNLDEFSEAKADLERFRSAAQFAATHWLLALCVFGRFGDAWGLSEQVRPIIFERLPMTSHVADYTLFRGLSAAVHAGESRGVERWRLLRAARRSERRLRRWAQDGADFAHMAALVGAERARTSGRAARALELYARAARDAEESAYRHHAALAHERRAGLLAALAREAEAQEARAQARELYRAWGADAKVRTLA